MSTAEYSPRARAERVIASGRTFLVCFALAGVLLTPADQGTFPNEALQLLGFYCVYSVLVWVATRRGALVTRRATALAHAVDLVIAVLLTMLTRGSGSPFFLFFAFMLLAATVRWQGWGAWSTGLVVIVAYVGVVAYEIAADAGPIEINRFAVRVGLLGVMTMILGQLGTYHQRLYQELRQLATSPRSPALTLDEVLRESLGYAARVLNAPAAVLLWQDEDHAQSNLAVLRGSVLDRRVLSAPMSEMVVVPADVRRFLHIGSTSGSRTLALSERPRELSTPVLGGDLVEQFEIETVIGAALPERSHHGWLLVLNRSPQIISTDDVLLADIVAADVSASVEHWSLSRRARDAAVAEARLLVSRDLHDGVLQSLTGCRLNIAAAAITAERASAESAAQLRALERSLAHDQQELREVIQDLRGLASPRPPAPVRDLCARVERQWGVSVMLTQYADSVVPDELNAPTLLMVHEALANAVRHGKAKSVRVAISRIESRLVIRVEDDGQGFPFTGTLQGHELAARGTGPRSLRERAEMLGGSLVVTSHDTGSTVEIAIPVSRESVCA